MSLTALGTTCGFSKTPWEDDEGKPRVSYKVSVATADGPEEISLDRDLLLALGDERQDLARVGVPVRIRCKVGAFGSHNGGAKLQLKALDVEFVALDELAAVPVVDLSAV